MKVYVITCGCYSDYQICAVTDDPKKAELLRIKYSDAYDEAQIEEYETEDNVIEADFKYLYWKIRIDKKTGKVLHCHSFYQLGYKRTGTTLYSKAYEVITMAENEEKAKKIAFDMIAREKEELIRREKEIISKIWKK